MTIVAFIVAAIALVFTFINRKEHTKTMDAVERINQITTRLASSVTQIRAKINAEAEQHRAAVQELKNLLADGSTHTTAELEAAFAKLESAVTNIESVGAELDAIVPDAEEPATEPATSETGGA